MWNVCLSPGQLIFVWCPLIYTDSLQAYLNRICGLNILERVKTYFCIIWANFRKSIPLEQFWSWLKLYSWCQLVSNWDSLIHASYGSSPKVPPETENLVLLGTKEPCTLTLMPGYEICSIASFFNLQSEEDKSGNLRHCKCMSLLGQK